MAVLATQTARKVYAMNMYDTRELGYRILRSRRDLNIDQTELSQRAGVSRPYISQLEHGKKANVSVDVIEALATALDVSPAYLLGYTDNPTGEPDAKVLAEQSEQYVVAEVDGADAKQNVRDLIAVYQRLPKSQQTALLGFIRSLQTDEETPYVVPRQPRIIGE
jgi:transcriptional regulator with XRE-family HTH domain